MFCLIKRALNNLLLSLIGPLVLQIVNGVPRIWGDSRRVSIHPTANVVNSVFNTASGSISIGEYSFTGHNVSFLTGTHDVSTYLKRRMSSIPMEGRDIKIGKGVWICSSAVILGPCEIADHAVVTAGSVVIPGTMIHEYQVFSGNPARLLKTLSPKE